MREPDGGQERVGRRHGGHQAQEPAAAVAAVARVARALAGVGGLSELSEDALAEISRALGLDVAAMYLPDRAGLPILRRLRIVAEADQQIRVSESLSFQPEAWHFVAKSRGPLVFRERAGWVVENPFEPPADSWLVLPLVADGEIMGAVVGCAAQPISLKPLAVATLTAIGDVLSGGVATARLRMEVQRTELQRERIRLAAELHDGLAQDLALAVRELAYLDAEPPPEAARASLERLREAVTTAHRVVRAGLEDLAGHGPVAGLNPAVQELCARFRRRGLEVTLVEPLPDAPVAPSLVVVVLRVLNEALTNVLRHAGVSEAHVAITVDDGTLTVTVIDDGRGVDPEHVVSVGGGHFGFATMRERAASAGGTMTILGRAEGGTIVELTLPIGDSA